MNNKRKRVSKHDETAQGHMKKVRKDCKLAKEEIILRRFDTRGGDASPLQLRGSQEERNQGN